MKIFKHIHKLFHRRPARRREHIPAMTLLEIWELSKKEKQEEKKK